MKKIFRRNRRKSSHTSDALEGPVPPTNVPPKQGPSASSSKSMAVLPVRSNYINLNDSAFPPAAISKIARARDEEIVLDRCRKCFNAFVHTFMAWTTRIIAGIPDTNDYRAASYVWGDTIPLPMRCSHCGHRFQIPMESAYKFRRLMMMTAQSGDSVWLDALSIDQTDDEEKARIIGVMGDIYSRAQTVAVLFPTADGEAFRLVNDMTQAATAINNNKHEFSYVGQDGTPDPRLAELSQVCRDFYTMLGEFNENLHKYSYWRRAWTFQEWALARNISITWEGGPPQNLEPVKTTALHAATLTSVYAFSQGAYATIPVGFPQAAVPGMFEKVRRLFPDEQAFRPPDMIDEKEIAIDMMLPSMRFGSALGLRAAVDMDLSRIGKVPVYQMYDLRPPMPESENERFRLRLHMALSTFSVSKREARYEADLVSCWASMCNIKFAYDAQDSYAKALQKVVHSLRVDHKVRVYNFHVNTVGASAEVDTSFQEYACQHEQCNAGLVKGKFNDIPIFSGRADTATYLRRAIVRPSALLCLDGSGVQLRKIKGARLVGVLPLTDHDGVMQQMSYLVSGTADQMVFTDVLNSISEILRSTPTNQLERSVLAVASIPLMFPGANEVARTMGLQTWAIIPSNLNTSELLVAREGLNGTLVLARPSGNAFDVVAYLTLTDHQSGTLLVNVDAHESDCDCSADHSKGQLQVTLKSPIRRGVSNSALFDDRLIRGSVEFETGSLVAY